MAGRVTGQGPCLMSLYDFGGFGFALGGPLAGGFRPQMYKIVPLEEEAICDCKKKKEKMKKEKKKKACKCGCETEDDDKSRLQYIPDAAMQLATLLPL